MIRKLPLLLSLCLTVTTLSYGQDNTTSTPSASGLPRFNIKTNLLYDATATFNLGAEYGLSDKTSLDLSVNWNPFTFSGNRKWKHVLVQPEFRIWTKERFAGWFYGAHAHYAYYNAGRLPKPFSKNFRENRFQGWATGAGIIGGYRWNFSERIGMEAVLGVGYAYMNYDKYPCAKCAEKTGSNTKHYFGPTKVALSLVVNLGKTKRPAAPVEPVYIAPVPEPAPVEVPPPYIPRLRASYIVPEVEAVKSRCETGKAFLDFAVGQSTVNASFKNNAAELDKINALIEAVKNNPDATITGIVIRGYASPEGTYTLNLNLSAKRAAALKKYIRSLYGFGDNLFTVEGKGEDWATLDSLVSQSDMQDKYTVLEIIRGTDIFDGRERKLMALSAGNPYRSMKAGLFPQLRRSEYELHYTVEPFTVEKGKEVFQVKPSLLSLNEMFLIANTYEAGSDAFNDVFETAARLFPHDDTANLNAAANALTRKDVVSAERYLSKVKEHNAAYYNNAGVLYGLKEQWQDAADAFAKAKASGDKEAAKNIGELDKRILNGINDIH